MRMLIVCGSIVLVACGGTAELGPAPAAECGDDAGAVVAAAAEACNAERHRGRCDDLLLPAAWGFERQCESDGGRAYKRGAGGATFEIRPELRAQCVAVDNDTIICCPEAP